MSSGEGSDTRHRAHDVSISSGEQTLQSPGPRRASGDCGCAHCDCLGMDATDHEDMPSDPIISDDLFQKGELVRGWQSMTWTQHNDPVWRIAQHFQGQCSIALWEMDREVVKLTKGFVDGGKDRGKYARKLRKTMPERTAFVNSMAAMESLPEPSHKDVEHTIALYPTGEEEDRQAIYPLTSPQHWKSLRRVTRQKKLADDLPWLGSFGEFVSRPFRIGQDSAVDGHGNQVTFDKYEARRTQAAVLVFSSVTIGVMVCIPIVILGLDVGSKGVKVAVIVLSIVFSGVGSAWWFDDPAIAVAAMLALAASLVNVSI